MFNTDEFKSSIFTSRLAPLLSIKSSVDEHTHVPDNTDPINLMLSAIMWNISSIVLMQFEADRCSILEGNCVSAPATQVIHAPEKRFLFLWRSLHDKKTQWKLIKNGN